MSPSGGRAAQAEIMGVSVWTFGLKSYDLPANVEECEKIALELAKFPAGFVGVSNGLFSTGETIANQKNKEVGI